MCDYCDNEDSEILHDIQTDNIPADALVEVCSWRRVCQVRGRNYSQVYPHMWSLTCQRRGYLFSRSNPRGF